MPTGVLRVGDANVGGGLITVGDPTVLVNNRPVAVIGAPVSPHPPCGANGGTPHCYARTQLKPTSIMVNGKFIATWPSVDTCLHPRITGSYDVVMGGL